MKEVKSIFNIAFYCLLLLMTSFLDVPHSFAAGSKGLYDDCYFADDFNNDKRNSVIVRPVGDICFRRCENECNALKRDFGEDREEQEHNTGVVELCKHNCLRGETGNYKERINDSEEKLKVETACSEGIGIDSPGYYYEPDISFNAGDYVRFQYKDSLAAYMCGVENVILKPQDHNANITKDSATSNWSARNYNFTDTGINVKDGDYLSITFSYPKGYKHDPSSDKKITTKKLLIRQPANLDNWLQAGSSELPGDDLQAVRMVEKDGGYDYKDENDKVIQGDIQTITENNLSISWKGLRASADFAKEGDESYPIITFSGFLQGFSQEFTRLGIKHFDSGSATNWANNEGGVEVKISRMGCPKSVSESVQYKIIYDDAPNAITEWKSISSLNPIAASALEEVNNAQSFYNVKLQEITTAENNLQNLQNTLSLIQEQKLTGDNLTTALNNEMQYAQNHLNNGPSHHKAAMDEYIFRLNESLKFLQDGYNPTLVNQYYNASKKFSIFQMELMDFYITEPARNPDGSSTPEYTQWSNTLTSLLNKGYPIMDSITLSRNAVINSITNGTYSAQIDNIQAQIVGVNDLIGKSQDAAENAQNVLLEKQEIANGLDQFKGFMAEKPGKLLLRFRPLEHSDAQDPNCGSSDICKNTKSKAKDSYEAYNRVGEAFIKVRIGTEQKMNDLKPNYLSHSIIRARNYFFGNPTKHPDGTITRDDGTVQQIFNNFVADSQLSRIIRAAIVFFMAWTGFSYMAGIAQLTQRDLIIRLVNLGIVNALLQPGSWEFFNTYLFGLFIDGGGEIIANVINYKDYNIDSSNLKSVSQEPALIFSIFDNVISILFSTPVWYKLGALFFSGFFGWYIALSILFAALIYFFVIIKAALIYTVSLIFLGILLTLAPIFLTFLLFKYTRKMFMAWIGQLISVTLQPVIVIAGISLFTNIFLACLYAALGFTACRACFIGFSIQPFFDFTCIIPSFITLNNAHSPDGAVLISPINNIAAGFCILIIAQAMYVFVEFSIRILNAIINQNFFTGLDLSGYANVGDFTTEVLQPMQKAAGFTFGTSDSIKGKVDTIKSIGEPFVEGYHKGRSINKGKYNQVMSDVNKKLFAMNTKMDNALRKLSAIQANPERANHPDQVITAERQMHLTNDMKQKLAQYQNQIQAEIAKSNKDQSAIIKKLTGNNYDPARSGMRIRQMAQEIMKDADNHPVTSVKEMLKTFGQDLDKVGRDLGDAASGRHNGSLNELFDNAFEKTDSNYDLPAAERILNDNADYRYRNTGGETSLNTENMAQRSGPGGAGTVEGSAGDADRSAGSSLTNGEKHKR